MTLSKNRLRKLYILDKKSVSDISKIFTCSENKINYWLKKYNINKRSISEAIYIKYNPKGDPFRIRKPKTLYEAELLGLGLGLYWGEGNKSNKYSVRLGNTDPILVKKFIKFLVRLCKINKRKLRFGLQVFSDMSPRKAQRFWEKELGVGASYFQKVVVTPTRSIGSYKFKTKHGVLTVYYGNKKLRDVLCKMIEKFK